MIEANRILANEKTECQVKIEKMERQISLYKEADRMPKTSTVANKELEIQRVQKRMEKLWYGD